MQPHTKHNIPLAPKRVVDSQRWGRAGGRRGGGGALHRGAPVGPAPAYLLICLPASHLLLVF